MTLSGAQLPKLNSPLGVIAVGQTVEKNGIPITLLSLELYSDGWRINLHLVCQFDLKNDIVQVSCHVGGDSESAFQVISGGGRGGRNGVWWQTVVCSPSISSDTKRILVEITEIRVITMSKTSNGQELKYKGPWVYHVVIE